jgi:hypothetical protein
MVQANTGASEPRNVSKNPAEVKVLPNWSKSIPTKAAPTPNLISIKRVAFFLNLWSTIYSGVSSIQELFQTKVSNDFCE